MKFTTALIALFAVATSVSAAPTSVDQPKGLFTHDPNAQQGWYTHHVGLDGSVVTTYHGDSHPGQNVTSPAPTKREPGGANSGFAPGPKTAPGGTKQPNSGHAPIVHPPSSGFFSSGHHKRAPYGVYCQSLTFDAGDGAAAIQGLTNTLNANQQFYHAISFVSGTAVAYGCDYGHGQNIPGSNVASYLGMVQNQCGNNKQAWFSLPDWKASYGITASGGGFC